MIRDVVLGFSKAQQLFLSERFYFGFHVISSGLDFSGLIFADILWHSLQLSWPLVYNFPT